MDCDIKLFNGFFRERRNSTTRSPIAATNKTMAVPMITSGDLTPNFEAGAGAITGRPGDVIKFVPILLVGPAGAFTTAADARLVTGATTFSLGRETGAGTGLGSG